MCSFAHILSQLVAKLYKPLKYRNCEPRFGIEFAPQSDHNSQSDATIILGGHFVPMSVARDLAIDLGLRVGEDSLISNALLHHAFNGWLTENNKFHILAATITWPRRLDSDTGIMFISKFEKEPLEKGIWEDEEALKVKNDIKGWSPTLKLPLQWISFADHYGITRRGIRPRPNPLVYVKRTLAEILASAQRYNATGCAAVDPID